MGSQVRLSVGSPKADCPGCYLHVQRVRVLSMLLLQLKDPLELFVTTNIVLPCYARENQMGEGVPKMVRKRTKSEGLRDARKREARLQKGNQDADNDR